ncbi:hypothetical protein GCM10009116_01560 [Brevundimonas basaltis]
MAKSWLLRAGLVNGPGAGAQAQQFAPVIGHDQQGLTALIIGLRHRRPDEPGDHLATELG